MLVGGVGILGVGVTGNVFVAITAYAVGAFGVSVWNVPWGALRQAIVPTDMLGRAMGIIRTIGWGLTPIATITGRVRRPHRPQAALRHRRRRRRRTVSRRRAAPALGRLARAGRRNAPGRNRIMTALAIDRRTGWIDRTAVTVGQALTPWGTRHAALRQRPSTPSSDARITAARDTRRTHLPQLPR